jgi:acyl-CoA thioesterase-1
MPFFLEGVAADPALNQPDGLHPNEEGVRVIVRNAIPYVLNALDRAEDRS